MRLDDVSTREVWKCIPVRFLTVRMQDVLSKSTGKFSKTYYDIMKMGGLHKFLGFDGPILLSSIMTDNLISMIDNDTYIKLIDTLQPDFYSTPDGETYDKENKKSLEELKRIVLDTLEILNHCQYGRPIGLVKGCNELQTGFHVRLLRQMGISSFMFHVSDFFRNGSPEMIRKARLLTSRIRPYADRLILYGMGSQKRLLEFSFADAYVSYNHFISVRYGKEISGKRKLEYDNVYGTDIVQKNLIQMYRNTESLNAQSTLGIIYGRRN